MTPIVTVTTTLPVFFGAVVLEWDDDGLIRCALEVTQEMIRRPLADASDGRLTPGQSRLLDQATCWVRDWEAGRFRPVDFPVHLKLVPAFSLAVLKTIARIPAGRTLTYAGVAREVGCPQGARAVGQVMARNPWPLFFPCHRVVGTGGPGGFGFGVDLKLRLLAHDGAAPMIPTRS